MISVVGLSTIFLGYLALLFAVAFYADLRYRTGRSIVANSWTYALSLGVYITAWTFYGTVGRAASVGLDFLPPVLGPTLMAFAWWFPVRKMVRICKENKVTTIADFISCRYGRSGVLGTFVTLLALLGMTPYLALQLKAIAHSFNYLVTAHWRTPEAPHWLYGIDTALWVALVMGFFGVLFGARHLDASERHEGMVAVVALESLVKLAALLAVGLFVTYGLFHGFGDIISGFLRTFPERRQLLQLGPGSTPYLRWFTLLLVGMIGVLVFPHQFHIMVIENSDEFHLKDAMWRFPAYLFLSSVFILPIALGGLVLSGGALENAEYFPLILPLVSQHPWLAILVFIGGFSAAMGMTIVTAVALAPMILNHLAMPLILRFKLDRSAALPRLLINIKRLAIFLVVMAGYGCYRVIGEGHTLASIGLASFLAAAQFAPALLGGLYWKRAKLAGALTGLILGFVVWFYTLLLPAVVESGWLGPDLLRLGPFGIGFLRPTELFGLTGLDRLTHSLFWSFLFNVGAFVAVSLAVKPAPGEEEQAAKFVDVFRPVRQTAPRQRIDRAPTAVEFIDLIGKFIGEKPAQTAAAAFLQGAEIDYRGSLPEAQILDLKRFAERTLAGAVGAAPARIIMANYMAARGSEMQDVFDIFGSVTISRRASREQLGILYEAASLVAQGGDLPAVLDAILELVRQQFGFDTCMIRLLDEERQVLAVWACKGASMGFYDAAARQLTMDTFTGECFLTNRVQVINDTDFMDKPVSAQIVHGEGIKSFAHAPITVEGKPVGVLSAHSKTAKGIFSDEFMELFASLAGLIGVAWHNAHLVESLVKTREKDRELQIARDIQMSLLPTRVPLLPGLLLAGVCLPAQEVGGDYYDFLEHGQDALDLVIADVSGHSVGSALTMGWIRTFVQERARSGRLGSAGTTLAEINSFFYDDLSRAELFASMFFLSLDLRRRRLFYANAGHNPALLFRNGSGTCAWLDAEGMLLGIRPQVAFQEQQTTLEPGDILVLYTDGIIEAENGAGEFFGSARLCAAVAEGAQATPAELLEHLVGKAKAFVGAGSFSDDLTLVILKID